MRFFGLFFAIIWGMGGIAAGAAECVPAAVLSGTADVRLRVRANSRPLRVTDAAGREIPCAIRSSRLSASGEYTVNLPEVPDTDTVLRIHFSAPCPGETPFFLPVIKRFHIVMTFDDGPAIGKTPDFAASPTGQVLNALDAFRHGENDARRGICAVFFLLTSPDRFLFDDFSKGETAFGAAMIRETARRGHVLGVHWGGGYGQQTITHPGHVREPGWHGGLTNRLEGELQQCADRIEELTGRRPEFVRPTLWVYRDKRNPDISALPTYRRLGLKMILTDAKYPDGGYKIISAFFPGKTRLFSRNLRHAFMSGERNLVFSMHDSNSQTAEALPRILETIKTTFDRLDFGTGSANRQSGRRLHFATTRAEAVDILRGKHGFVMFPETFPARK